MNSRPVLQPSWSASRVQSSGTCRCVRMCVCVSHTVTHIPCVTPPCKRCKRAFQSPCKCPVDILMMDGCILAMPRQQLHGCYLASTACLMPFLHFCLITADCKIPPVPINASLQPCRTIAQELLRKSAPRQMVVNAQLLMVGCPELHSL